jgi:hypothetical protein
MYLCLCTCTIVYIQKIFVIAAHRSMWSVTNYFLFNLTLADLMMASLNCLPSFIFMRDRCLDYCIKGIVLNCLPSFIFINAMLRTRIRSDPDPDVLVYGLGSGSGLGPSQYEKSDPDKICPDPQHCMRDSCLDD